MTIIKFLHLLSLVIWIGGMVFFMTIGAPSIFKVLPRETAGDVLGVIFPKYWFMGYLCGAAALITILIISIKEHFYPWFRIALLILMTVLTLYSGLVVAARAREVRLQIRTVEDAAQKEILTARFRSLHSKSVSLNVIILLSGLAVLYLMIYPESS